MAQYIDALFLVGRLLFGGFFLLAAYNHLFKAKDLIGYAKYKGLKAPRAAVYGTGLMLLVGSLLVMLGVYPLLGLAFIGAFLLGVTPQMHAFWKVDDPMARQTESIMFQKNVALLGATLALAIADTPWAYALPI